MSVEQTPFLSVPRYLEQKVRERLSELSLLDDERKIVRLKKKIYFPLSNEIVMGSVFPDFDTKDWIIGFRKFQLSKKVEEKTKSKKRGKGRRTLTERVESIFEFIEMQPEPFAKSELQKIGLNPSSAEKWLQLIEYIQNQPMIKLTKMGNSLYIEKLENKYLSMLRRRILDPNLSYKEREQTLQDYVGALITLEKIEEGRIKQ
ncbi:MAG: hypothetical protein GF411_03990 [Candidatus Lokiarchaeota archaeon]|nr:hypothetical protein [Candidatus Lokiarchaeota archaeon]